MQVGAPVRIVMTKWGGRPHWEIPGHFLGSDPHGDWIAIPRSTHMTRPGAEYVSPVDQVGLVPAPGPEPDRGWLATFHARGGQVQVYVDITTPAYWDGPVLHAVDLDLDVVRGNSGRVWVDDEDEFAEHRISLGYPDDLATAAMASCDRVHAEMLAGRAPYDGESHRAWLSLVPEPS